MSDIYIARNPETRQGVVLTKTERGEFVTHRFHLDQPSRRFWGRYFTDFAEAKADYLEREQRLFA